MNYIEQINVFWKLDAEHSFNGNESRLYFYLLNLSNSLYWKNPLTNADGYTATVVGVSVNTLKSVRNRLQQAGLISFKTGGGARNKCQYWIVPAAQVLRSNAGRVSAVDTFPDETLTPYSIPGLEKTDDISKHKPDENKNHPAQASPPPPKKVLRKKDRDQEETEPYWQDLVKIWFDFNQEKFGDDPSFTRDEPKILKRIIGRLKKRAEAKGVQWTQAAAVDRFKKFLDSCFEDPWLATHFLLKNLESQFDTIILSQKNGNKNGQTKQSYSHRAVITGTAESAGSL